MASTYKVLGQVAIAAANTEENLYTVPGVTSTITSTITATNRGTTTATVRIAIRPSADGATTAKHYIYYDIPVPPKDTFATTIGITMATGDKIRVEANSTNISISAFGTEVA